MKRLTIEVDDAMFVFLKSMAAVKNVSLRRLVTEQLGDYVTEQVALGFKGPVVPPAQNQEQGD